MKHRPLASEWWRSSARKALCLKTSYLCCSNGKDFKGTQTGMLEDKDLEVKHSETPKEHSETHKSLKYHWFILISRCQKIVCVFHCNYSSWLGKDRSRPQSPNCEALTRQPSREDAHFSITFWELRVDPEAGKQEIALEQMLQKESQRWQCLRWWWMIGWWV